MKIFIYFTIFFFTCTLYAFSQTSELKLSGYDMYSFSPDGKSAAVVYEADGMKKIYICDTYSKKIERLTKTRGTEILPAWSPDGSKIAFYCFRGNLWSVFIADTAEGQLLKTIPVYDITPVTTEPVWSHDSGMLIYSSFAGGSWNLWSFNFTNNSAKKLTDDDRKEILANFSPDDTTVYYSSVGLDDAFIAKLPLTDGAVSQIPGYKGALLPNISPSGKYIAFVESCGMKSDLCLCDLQTGECRVLFYSDYFISLPKFSPSEDRIAFLTENDTERQICIIGLDGGKAAVETSCPKTSLIWGLKWNSSGIISWVRMTEGICTIEMRILGKTFITENKF